jgi:N-acetylglutamate synthase-like GNAT family acetyltransferase
VAVDNKREFYKSDKGKESQFKKNLIFKIPDDSELIDTAKFYLRTFGSNDLSKIGELVNFWKLFIDGKICYFTIVKYNGKTVGCGAVVPYHSLAWIAWMAVDPIFQRKGIGNEIMKNLMDYTKKSGLKTLRLDATNIGMKLYSKFGFRKEYRVLWYEFKFRNHPKNIKELEISLSNNIPGWCLKLDKEAFGDDRSKLLKLLLSNGGKIIMVENKGYGILWKNRIGPVVANDVEIAKNIVRYASKNDAERIYVPLYRDMPGKFLSDLKEKKRDSLLTCCTRMIYGDVINEDTKKVYASFTAGTG